MKTGLTIAGSDCSGGAGIQADIKTMTTNGVYATSAITALTAQNTTGVRDILEVSPQFLKEQLDCIFTDIRPDAVKIGMVSSTELIEVIAGSLRQYEAAHIVVDPVMVATSGARLIREDAICAMQEKLFKIAEVITPNIPEAELLSGIEIQTQRDMERAAEMIGRQFGCSVLLKGGHQRQDANDLLWKEDGAMRWFYGTRIENPNTHGFQIFFHKCLLSDLKLFFGICCLIAQQSGYTNVWHTRCLSFSIPTLALSKSGHRSKRFSFLSACLIRKLPCFLFTFIILRFAPIAILIFFTI